MKLTIEQTDTIVEVNGVPGRIWNGRTESGVEVSLLVTRIALPLNAPAEEQERFSRELQEQKAPPNDAARAWPARFFTN